jgi:hypothetical protein
MNEKMKRWLRRQLPKVGLAFARDLENRERQLRQVIFQSDELVKYNRELLKELDDAWSKTATDIGDAFIRHTDVSHRVEEDTFNHILSARVMRFNFMVTPFELGALGPHGRRAIAKRVGEQFRDALSKEVVKVLEDAA